MNMRQIAVKPDLEQNGGESDGRDDHDGERTEEGASPRENHDHSQREKQQARSNHGPSSGDLRARTASGVGRGIIHKAGPESRPKFGMLALYRYRLLPDTRNEVPWWEVWCGPQGTW